MKNIIIVLTAGLLLGLGAGYIFFYEGSDSHEHTAGEEKTLYSCGMHPEVISEEPGNCPICGMKLTPLKDNKQQASGEREILYWQAPMDPTEIYDEPGKSKMGMDLVPVYADEAGGGAGLITIDGRVRQNMNLRTAPVVQRRMEKTLRLFGQVVAPEDRVFTITSKVNGWVEKLHVNKSGVWVKQDQPLMEIYSPELLTTQQELVNASRMARNESNLMLVESAERRLRLWGVSNTEINKLKETGEVRETLLIRAPYSGYVTKKMVNVGDRVSAGMGTLFEISDLSQVWLEATVYENDLPYVKEGQMARVSADYLPDFERQARLDFIYPYLDPASRSGTVRFVVDNPKNTLKPGMFVNTHLTIPLNEQSLAVPSESVIHSGARRIVFVEVQEGAFEPREIRIGVKTADGWTEVRSGLRPGEMVVTSGQFLLDSESQTREAIAKMRSASMQSDVDEEMGDMAKEGDHEQDQDHDHAYYACPMHPDFITSDPDGRCPECGMKLSPLSEVTGADTSAVDFYTCPMHPEFVTTDPEGRCSICEMKLVPQDQGGQ